jgi:pyroglutamyl-peptidase
MTKTLITSFEIWEAHHTSNSSDDLLAEMLVRQRFDDKIYLLRKVPVDFEVAPATVIAKIDALQPDVIICCGMAETRSQLSIESNGKYQGEVLETMVEIEQLVKELSVTTISHDAGQFVCNHLYHAVLKHIQIHQLTSQAIFVHVPLLNFHNLDGIVEDFSTILDRLKDHKIHP